MSLSRLALFLPLVLAVCPTHVQADPIVIFFSDIAMNIVIDPSPFTILELDTRGVANANVGNLGAVSIGAFGPTVPVPNSELFAINIPANTEQEIVALQYNALMVGPFDPSAPIFASVPAFVTPFNGSPITDPALESLLGLDTFTFQFVSGSPVAPDGTQTLTFDLVSITEGAVPEPARVGLVAGHFGALAMVWVSRRRRLA
jgi:hypothetical protein